MGTVTNASPRRSFAGRVLYGAFFVVRPAGGACPVGSRHAQMFVHASSDSRCAKRSSDRRDAACRSFWPEWLALWRRGGGLPMNAFPPPRFVSGGIYALVPHPIYGGFVLACAGVAVYTGSASGLWLVTPTVALGCAALVLGYELPDLRRRFGPAGLSVVAGQSGRERRHLLRAIAHLRRGPAAMAGGIRTDRRILGRRRAASRPGSRSRAVCPLSSPPSWSTPAFTRWCCCSPSLSGSAAALRLFASRAGGDGLIFPLYLLLPFYAPPRPFAASRLRADDAARAQPHRRVLGHSRRFMWYGRALPRRAWAKASRWKKAVAWPWAILRGGQLRHHGHAFACRHRCRICRVFRGREPASHLEGDSRARAERIANSWREWRIGPACASSTMAPMRARALRPASSSSIRCLARAASGSRSAFVFALWWARRCGRNGWKARPRCCVRWDFMAACSADGGSDALRVRSSRRSVERVCGGGFGGAVDPGARPAAVPGAGLLPWAARSEGLPGIRYTHPRSRVCRLAHLAGVPVHATPVYSILWNVVGWVRR